MKSNFFTDSDFGKGEMDDGLFNDYFTSISNDIKEEIYSSFPLNSKIYHIYTKLNLKNKTFKIFVSLLKGTESNQRETNIKFLINVNSSYPSVPPMVFCLTDVK